MGLSVIVLAAGEGKRMRSPRPKVLADLAGRPLIAHVLEAAAALQPARVRVVLGHGADAVRAAMPDEVEIRLQPEQRGTGDAVACAIDGIPDDDLVLVLCGDVPLVRPASLQALVDAATAADGALMTVELADPTGYGRILRAPDGALERIVEHKDADADERAIGEINTGLLALPAATLARHVDVLDNDNAQGEYYLTDVIGAVRAAGGRIEAVRPEFEWEVQGVNSPRQLADLERAWQRHLAGQLLDAGVCLRDPGRIDIRGTLTAAADVLIDVGCVFEGTVELGPGVRVGAHCVLRDCRIGAGTTIEPHSQLDGSETGEHCRVGPFARLRPGTVLAGRARVGNFVETKNAAVGMGSKINHLSYIGDAEIGREANIGAGTITCNYDGMRKHRTVIGDGAFIGSDTQLVAPVTVGAGATIGAGSTITHDAPAGQLTFSRSRQRTLSNWVPPSAREED
ncbi:MAG: bifunctional UDP-N-acetylglucosamine diphosphorylase/glucosamine-1-phosphate N-acetyltransferase GlmU [Halofilum sp. (in: g-proteobacteria)]|nr:bifunctional UDP-N-acetylglucosamine diphosphorylase/glucosamine-1-phosphate N-acetyltransferase GlmU [Halofilum sp. (in: g-proteobacteria)]